MEEAQLAALLTVALLCGAPRETEPLPHEYRVQETFDIFMSMLELVRKHEQDKDIRTGY